MGDGSSNSGTNGHAVATTDGEAVSNGSTTTSKTAAPINSGHSTTTNGAATSTTATSENVNGTLPVLIIGAGPSGLLLAQSLRRRGVPFRIFERDADFTTRGVGWGLTLNWALPILRELLPEGLGEPESIRNRASCDRKAVEAGVCSQFPYYDLTTGERITAAPPLPETLRSRVTRARLRTLLATNLNIEWNMKFVSSDDHGGSITAYFDNGSAIPGRLVVACDGANSKLRKEIFAKQGNADLQLSPVRMLGIKMYFTPEEMVEMRKCDPFFLHGTSSHDSTFGYFSLLDAPGNTESSTDKFLVQICISWLAQPGFMGNDEPVTIPETNEGRVALFKSIASSWAEPFRSLGMSATNEDEVKGLQLMEWVPPKDLRSKGRAVLMGDSLHTMTMFRGDGANHALADVQDFDTHVAPLLEKTGTTTAELREALSVYETTVVLRARPGLFASRRAGLDAHNFEGMTMTSPLLTPRMRNLQYDEETE